MQLCAIVQICSGAGLEEFKSLMAWGMKLSLSLVVRALVVRALVVRALVVGALVVQALVVRALVVGARWCGPWWCGPWWCGPWWWGPGCCGAVGQTAAGRTVCGLGGRGLWWSGWSSSYATGCRGPPWMVAPSWWCVGQTSPPSVKPLPYQAVMQPVRILSMVHL